MATAERSWRSALHGLIFVACTIVFWRTSPVGIVALMILCAGDGLADLVGRRLGRRRLPINPTKSWAGSAAMFLGGYATALLMVVAFEGGGLLQPSVAPGPAAVSIAWIALACTVVEALPLPDLDNLTISLTAVALGLALF
jgi:dolichol kinase